MDTEEYERKEVDVLGFLKRWINELFHVYEPGYEYWVYTSQIKIKKEFLRTSIGEKKWKRKKEYFYRTGEFESTIKLNRDFVLVDGYSSYRIALMMGIQKVPVVFVEEGVE